MAKENGDLAGGEEKEDEVRKRRGGDLKRKVTKMEIRREGRVEKKIRLKETIGKGRKKKD